MGSGASVPGEMSEEDSTFKDYLGDNSKMGNGNFLAI
jgi:hypothetical protein